ncbi:MAG: T9SS type A sorting domain-containing protein [Chitinivibrionales bacterium]|nr:T9SS type A sorting domain-containing protein [Chitinivibrionales bacterium]
MCSEAWRNMFAYPQGEEGLRLNSSQVRSAIGFSSSRHNLITVKLIIPSNAGFSHDDYDVSEAPLWIAFAEYHKDSHVFYVIDTQGSPTGTVGHTTNTMVGNPISVVNKDGFLSIDLPEAGSSTVSVNSINGRRIMVKNTNESSLSIPLNSLATGMHVLNVVNGAQEITQSLIVH